MKKCNGVFFSLIKKRMREQTYSFRKGNFDVLGTMLEALFALSLAAIFAIFLKKFSSPYLGIPSQNVPDAAGRRFELLSILCFLLFMGFSLAGASKLSREFFGREDLFLFSAMPIRGSVLFFAGIVTSYLSLLPASLLVSLSSLLLLFERITFGAVAKVLLFSLLLPLLSLSVGALLSLPYHAVVRFLKSRYLLTLLLCTLLLAGGFFLYAKLLGGVKALLLNDDLKYFFSEERMNFIGRAAHALYPGVFFARFFLKTQYIPLFYIVGASFAGYLLSLVFVRFLSRFMQKPKAGGGRIEMGLRRKRGRLFALLFKERKEILRSPAYSFSCFATAAILPLMVYFCMSTGNSLVKRVVGIDCANELALFLTLIFGSLCNVFCSTNVSREGENFYCLKAMPLSAWNIFGAKILFCLFVSLLSQGASALVLYFTGYVSLPMSLFLWACGTLFSFAQICFATKADFSRANFSAFEEGEAKESSKTASAVILAGLLSSFLVGGASLYIKLVSALKFQGGTNLLYLSGGVVAGVALLCFWYFAHRLRQKYESFSGGGLL